MTDETKAALESIAVNCDAGAAMASAGADFYFARHDDSTAEYFKGERSAWREAARMLREKADQVPRCAVKDPISRGAGYNGACRRAPAHDGSHESSEGTW